MNWDTLVNILKKLKVKFQNSIKTKKETKSPQLMGLSFSIYI